MKKNRLLLHLDNNDRIHGVFHECAAMTLRWPLNLNLKSQPHLGLHHHYCQCVSAMDR